MNAANAAPSIRGLYAITPDEPDTARLARLVKAALGGGASVVQYRNKTADADTRKEQARVVIELCRAAQVPVIVNDDLDLALALDADGVHLGASDAALAEARARLAPGKLLGASCYDRLELAKEAAAQGADYVAFGSVFESTSKPQAVRAPLELFGQAQRVLGLPVVAIGGITHANAARVIRAGADAIAVINALFDARDVALAAREFQSLFSSAS